MRLILFCCSESTAVDTNSQRLSVFNFSDSFQSPTFPVVVPSMSVVAWMEREADEPETLELTTRLLLNKRKIADLPITFRFQDKLRARTIANIGGLIIEAPGILETQLRFGRKKLGTWTILVQPANNPPAIEAQLEAAIALPKPGPKRKPKG